MQRDVTALGQSTACPRGSSGELDEVTLALARSSDPDACTELVRRYQDRVFALLGRMLVPRGLGTMVEDLAQETFLRVFRALPRFESGGPAKLSTWISCIAVRLAINELQRMHPRVVDLVDELPSSSDSDVALLRSDEVRRLHQAIAALSVEQQSVFVLREFHGLDYQAIADATDLEVGAVKSRLFRARAKLREMLSEVDDGEG